MTGGGGGWGGGLRAQKGGVLSTHLHTFQVLTTTYNVAWHLNYESVFSRPHAFKLQTHIHTCMHTHAHTLIFITEPCENVCTVCDIIPHFLYARLSEIQCRAIAHYIMINGLATAIYINCER